MNNKTLIRTDKNGTKYYHVVCTCGKCCGRGEIPVFYFNQGGVCFDCGGHGVVEYQTKEYTPEYLKKLEERAEKKAEKERQKRIEQSEELNRAFFNRNGFDENGNAYVALGNTYDIKDDLKANGFRFKNEIGWFCSKPNEKFRTIRITADEVYEKDPCGVYIWNSPKKNYYLGDTLLSEEEASEDWTYESGFKWEFAVVDRVKKLNSKFNSESENGSRYFGNVGDKVEVELKVERVIDCSYSISEWNSVSSDLYIMKDKNGNVFTWKTSSCPHIEIDGRNRYLSELKEFTLKGTIKDHLEYNGVKQTVLTRCKVIGGE